MRRAWPTTHSALGWACVLSMPRFTPGVKVERAPAGFVPRWCCMATRWTRHRAHAWRAADEQGLILCAPYDDEAAAAGQHAGAGDAAGRAPNLDTLVIAVGGAADRRWQRPPCLPGMEDGVQRPRAFPAMVNAIQGTHHPRAPTIAEGIAGHAGQDHAGSGAPPGGRPGSGGRG